MDHDQHTSGTPADPPPYSAALGESPTQPLYVPDTGDHVARYVADPPGEPVTDPAAPGWVAPAWYGARVNPGLLLPPVADGDAALRRLHAQVVNLPPDDTTAVEVEAGTVYRSGLATTPAEPSDLPPVGTSLPSAPDDDPERDPEGHA